MLSCFSESSPPITVYQRDLQIQKHSIIGQWFLENEVVVDPLNKLLVVPELLIWYGKDFGRSKKDLIKYIAHYLKPSQLKTVSLSPNHSTSHAPFQTAVLTCLLGVDRRISLKLSKILTAGFWRLQSIIGSSTFVLRVQVYNF